MKTTLCLLVLALAGCSLGHVYQSEDGKFSYTLPDGWSVHEFPGQEYQIAYGAGEGSYATNLHMVAQEFDGPLEVYVEGSKNMILGMFPGSQQVGSGLFDTTSGIRGFKMVVKVSQMGLPLMQAWYFFPGKGEYFVATASTLVTDFDAQEKAIDSCMRSFALR